MRKAASKALYLFLCAILGMILFVMLHRAIFVLYDLLLFLNVESFAFGMNSMTIDFMDFLTLLVALFLGGWYGTMMGLEWYAMVYGPNAEFPPGLFHGFIPHHWRGRRVKKVRSTQMATPSVVAKPAAPETTSTLVKVPVREIKKESPKTAVREWTFDDLIVPKPAPKKRVAVKKTVAKKTPRKPAVRKTKVTE
jgi:hypothetical protein